MQASDMSNPPLIAILAGEESGDQLGADLIVALRQRYPAAQFVGIGGSRMQAQDFASWYDMSELSLFGFSEVITHLPRLLRLRRALIKRLRKARPAVVIGIDAPDFNLGVERRLKQAGVRTVHYVSPSVWAWRENRAEIIGRSADLVLCLFPMEPAIYAKHGIDARFVGHPLADSFALVSDRMGARSTLQLPQQNPILAVLPGSRLSELARLGPVFLDAAARVATAMPGLRIVIPAANAKMLAGLKKLLVDKLQGEAAPLLLEGHAH
ncbi:MAG: lipid-A-disaccharide synthase, partial [Rhodanobacter sp.]